MLTTLPPRAPSAAGAFYVLGLFPYDLILKCHAFRIVFGKPALRRLLIREYLEVVAIANLLARSRSHRQNKGPGTRDKPGPCPS